MSPEASIRKILLLEFLHAHAHAYEESSASMHCEGWEMLQAVATDLTAVPGVSVSVVACSQAAQKLQQLSGVELILTKALTGPRQKRRVGIAHQSATGRGGQCPPLQT